MENILSIVIPAYNEQSSIECTLDKIIEYFQDTNTTFELIIVDDGSSDNSLEILKKYRALKYKNILPNKIILLNNKRNMGKGFSVQRGVLKSKGKFVLFTDADLSTPIEEVGKMLLYLQNGYNITLGSRSLKESKVIIRQNILRQSMGKIFNKLVRLFLNIKYSDTQCGFKCFDRKAVDMIFPILKIMDFSFDVEILYLAQKLGLNVIEIPVRWKNVEDSKVNIIKDSIKMLYNLTRIRRIHKKIL